MTEALNRHLPERPRLRVPLRARVAVVARPSCRARLASALKPSSLPFAALKAMSENPTLFRRFWSLLPALLLALSLTASRAVETNAPAAAISAAPAIELKPVAVAATNNTAAVTALASTNVTAAAAPSPTATPTTSDSGRRDRERGSSSAPASNAPPGSLESFRLIAERNIFDPNRSPRAVRSSGPAEEPKRMPKIEAFALAGTMSFSNRHMAFFTSSSSQYQKALKPGDAIAGYQIGAVAPDHVKLEKDGAAVELKLNQQMRREDEGPWQVSARTESVSSSSGGTSSSGASASSSAPAVPAGASELLKRLMEQRAKEQ